jgi:conjugative relaxase-like TrwC/TraI family protein
MISMHQIGSSGDAANYYDKAFKQDGVSHADNYYAGEQASALWEGKGAEVLGLKGQAVKREDFVAFLEGRLKNPATGEIQDLSKNTRGDRRLGYDFTVSPPKSVSIVGLVGNDKQVVDAHLAANERAMAWLEKNASVIRVKDGNDGLSAKQAGNLLYATVLHETNRNNEPQIHSHNVIVSAVYDEASKKWRSLTNDQLLILRQGADVVYKAELAHGLQRAGYKLEYASNGVDFEVAGLSREQIEAYSTRTAEIKQALKDRGIVGEADYHQRQIATIDTRAAKNEQPRDALQAVWQEVAVTAKLDVGVLVNDAHLTSKAQETSNQLSEGATSTRDKEKAVNSVSWAVAHLSEREQSFTRPLIEIEALKFGRGRIDQIESAVDQQIGNGSLIERGSSRSGAVLLTTNTAVESEKELVRNVRTGIGMGNTVLTTDTEFNAALQAFENRKSQEVGATFKLTAEQVVAARNVLMHGDVYQGIQGDAGTGKTAALEMVQEVTKAKGWIVMGVATSSVAAKELEASSGIPSQTVAGFLTDRENALRLAKVELSELRENLSRNENSLHANMPRIEVHKLSLSSDGVNHGAAKYTFDHERGEVYKSPDSLRNQLGGFLLDVSAGQRETPVDRSSGQESLIGRLRDRAVASGGGLAESLGQRLMTYEKIGTVESIAARNSLYLKQDSELGALKFKMGSKQAEIANLERTGNKEGRNMLVVMSRLAKVINARVVFQGDIKQHGSVSAGRAFEQALQAGMNKSVLQETRRFDNATEPTRQAVALMSTGRMAEAIAKLDRLEVDNLDLPKTVAERYLKNLEELQSKGVEVPRIGIATVTNNDRKAINQAVHDILATNGRITGPSLVKPHLDNPKLTEAQQLDAGMLRAANVDQLVFRKSYREIGVKKDDVVQVKGFDTDKNTVTIVNAQGKEVKFNPKQQDYFTPMRLETREYSSGDKIEARANIQFDDKKAARIDNGTQGVISSIDENGATVKWQESRGGFRDVRLNNDQLRMVDLSYARTTFKEQGATNDREIIAISKVGAKVFNTQAAYVAGSRAKGNTELVTSDYQTMLKNSGKSVDKTTAIDIEQVKGKAIKQGPVIGSTIDKAKVQEKDNNLQRARTTQNLGFTLE